MEESRVEPESGDQGQTEATDDASAATPPEPGNEAVTPDPAVVGSEAPATGSEEETRPETTEAVTPATDIEESASGRLETKGPQNEASGETEPKTEVPEG